MQHWLGAAASSHAKPRACVGDYHLVQHRESLPLVPTRMARSFDSLLDECDDLLRRALGPSDLRALRDYRLNPDAAYDVIVQSRTTELARKSLLEVKHVLEILHNAGIGSGSRYSDLLLKTAETEIASAMASDPVLDELIRIARRRDETALLTALFKTVMSEYGDNEDLYPDDTMTYELDQYSNASSPASDLIIVGHLLNRADTAVAAAGQAAAAEVAPDPPGEVMEPIALAIGAHQGLFARLHDMHSDLADAVLCVRVPYRVAGSQSGEVNTLDVKEGLSAFLQGSFDGASHAAIGDAMFTVKPCETSQVFTLDGKTIFKLEMVQKMAPRFQPNDIVVAPIDQGGVTMCALWAWIEDNFDSCFLPIEDSGEGFRIALVRCR